MMITVLCSLDCNLSGWVRIFKCLLISWSTLYVVALESVPMYVCLCINFNFWILYRMLPIGTCTVVAAMYLSSSVRISLFKCSNKAYTCLKILIEQSSW